MANKFLKQVVNKSYEYGFVTAIESDELPPGLSEDIVREISRRKTYQIYNHHRQHKIPRVVACYTRPKQIEHRIGYSLMQTFKAAERVQANGDERR